jgi:tetratricopeptide (TPR) repeat protein
MKKKVIKKKLTKKQLDQKKIAKKKLSRKNIMEMALIYGLPLAALGIVAAVESTIGKEERRAEELYARGKKMEEDGLHIEALITYRYAITLTPLNQDILYGLGRMYIAVGEMDAASEVLEELQELDKSMAQELKFMIMNS